MAGTWPSVVDAAPRAIESRAAFASPTWFRLLAAACLIALTASGVYAFLAVGRAATAVAERSTAPGTAAGRWRALDESTVFDPEFGMICDLLDQTCLAPPASAGARVPIPGVR